MDKRGKIMILAATIAAFALVLFLINLDSYIKVQKLVDDDKAVRIQAEIYDYDIRYSGTSDNRTKNCTNYFEYFVEDIRYVGSNSKCESGYPIGKSVII